MKIESNLQASEVTVALDIRHPFAHIALGPSLEFARELGIGINLLPRVVPPLHPPSVPTPGDDRGIRHRRHRAQMIAREIAAYAAAQDLVLQEPYRTDSPDPAHLAWLFVRAQSPEQFEPFLLEIFRRYWSLALDASDLEAVAKFLAEFGLDSAAFLEWANREGTPALERITADLDAAGAVAVPSYLACGQAFHGRQHLPMIKWLLEGSTGPVPI